MDRMHRGMAVTPTGDADVDFARMMIRKRCLRSTLRAG